MIYGPTFFYLPYLLNYFEGITAHCGKVSFPDIINQSLLTLGGSQKIGFTNVVNWDLAIGIGHMRSNWCYDIYTTKYFRADTFFGCIQYIFQV